MSATVERPLVRYYGGKWLLAPWIITHLPKHRTYTEVFGGGASVLLRKKRAPHEVYNDMDKEIVNLFKVARDHSAELILRVQLTPYARDEYLLAMEPTADPIEKARRTLVRSWMGFGTDALLQLKASGFRAGTRITTSTARNWQAFGYKIEPVLNRLQGVVIENRDAFEVLAQQDIPEAVHYVDPPYVLSTRAATAETRGYRHEMEDKDHMRLAEFLGTLQGAVIVSGYDCPLYKELYAGWDHVSRKAHADGGLERTEHLWLRNVRARDAGPNMHIDLD